MSHGHVENRLVTRFEASDGLTARLVPNDPTQAHNELRVVDISVGGCCIEAKCPVPLHGAVTLMFYRNGRPASGSMTAYAKNRTQKDSTERLHLQFDAWQQLVQAKALAVDHVRPMQNTLASKQRLERQRALAVADLSNIRKSIQDARSRLFALGMGVLTFLLAVVGAYLAVLNSYAQSRTGASTQVASTLPSFVHPEALTMHWWWLLVIAAAPLTLAPVFMLTAAQLQAEILRFGSFAMLLERSLVDGNLPVAYRGWEDAFANYNVHWRREAAENGGDVRIHPELPTKPSPLKYVLRVLTTRHVPPDMSYLLCVGLFLIVMPAIGVTLVSLNLAQWMHSMGSLSFLLAPVLLALVLLYYCLPYKELKSVYSGARSFDQCLIRFSEIIHNDPPYSPFKGRGLADVDAHN